MATHCDGREALVRRRRKQRSYRHAILRRSSATGQSESLLTLGCGALAWSAETGRGCKSWQMPSCATLRGGLICLKVGSLTGSAARRAGSWAILSRRGCILNVHAPVTIANAIVRSLTAL